CEWIASRANPAQHLWTGVGILKTCHRAQLVLVFVLIPLGQVETLRREVLVRRDSSTIDLLVQEPHLLFLWLERKYVHAFSDRTLRHNVLPAILHELCPLDGIGNMISVFVFTLNTCLFGRGYREQGVLVRRRFPLLDWDWLAEHVHESCAALGVLLQIDREIQ